MLNSCWENSKKL